MTGTEKQIVKIGGIKMEVDMRHAKRVDTFHIGDPVKLLLTEGNSVMAGVIVGFEEFLTLPTIVVAYLSMDYFNSGLKFAYINTESADKYELVASDRDNLLELNKADVLEKLDSEITKKEVELAELQSKKRFFLERFGVYFGEEAEV